MSEALTRAFEAHRPLLWGICYRMSGCAADADDLVQDVFERALARPPQDMARELRPWLTRVAVNAARDHLRSRRRRSYDGPWLVGPVETEGMPSLGTRDAEARYGELESVTVAFLTALEALTPGQRAVLLLRDVLGHTVRETAEVLQLGESNVKTTLHRARRAMASYDTQRLDLSAERLARHRSALQALLLHLGTGNVAALERLFASDVRALNDADGEYFAARVPVEGRDKVVRFHLNVQRLHRERQAGLPRYGVRMLNGEPAVVIDWPTRDPNQPRRMVFRIALGADGRLTALDTVVASRKLAALDFEGLSHLPSLAELTGALRAGLTYIPARDWAGETARRAAALAAVALGSRVRRLRRPVRRAR